ncbi:MAG: class I adenylate-forming enzyme family protein [Candidatus Scalinduaceae bacterium]
MDKMEDKVLPQWISEHGDRHPNKIAIIHGDKKITYADLYDNIRRLAGGMISLGIQWGDRVVLLLKNSPEFIISFFAIAKVEAVAVPLNVQYKEQELTDYIRDSKPKIIIASRQIIPLIKEITSFIADKECTIIGVPDGEDESFSYMSLIKENFSLNGTRNLSPQSEVLCQYSSGSTGQPKRIIRTHFNLISEAEQFCTSVNMTGNDKILCVVPLFHAHGLGNCMLASTYAGATLVILEDFNRRRILKTIQEEQITVFPGVPFMFNMLADTPLRDEITLSSLRLCFSAGAPLPHRTFQKFYEKYGVSVRQLYGSTETGSVSINLDENISKTVESVGLPMKNVEVEIFGMNGEVLPPDETGNMGIRSPAMIMGYSGLEALNRESFRDGYFFPGDLGKKDNSGNLYITGRKTLFINTGGNKVDPSEIEMLLVTHPKVEEVVVVGVKNHYGEDIIKAVVIPNGQCNEREIVDFCEGKISDFKIPRIVEFRKEIPKSPLGKVLKKYLC